MEKLLQNIIKRQKTELNSLLARKMVLRTRASDLESHLSSKLIKVVIGPRRAGKSTLCLAALQHKKFSYLNFEDESLPKAIDGDILTQAMDAVYGEVDYYLFDEIQNLDRWEPFLNRLQRKGKNIIITGSNSQLLSDELSSALTGRHTVIEILPFSFREIQTALVQHHSFQNFLQFGGFPEVATGGVVSSSYLSALWDAVILKDITKRKKVRNVSGLHNTLSLLLSSMTSSYNVDALQRALSSEVSAPTIKKFIEYGREAYLIAPLTLYSQKPKQRIKSDRKIYTIDNGFFTSKNIALSENLGVLLENAVFHQLRVQGYHPNLSMFYYITRSGYEVDFLLRDGHKNIAIIQVCYSLGSLKTRERELRALKEASEELQVSNLQVVNMSEESTESYEGMTIEVVPAEKWFLQ
jgi:predicted AAA+ superfamily ATPase